MLLHVGLASTRSLRIENRKVCVQIRWTALGAKGRLSLHDLFRHSHGAELGEGRDNTDTQGKWE